MCPRPTQTQAWSPHKWVRSLPAAELLTRGLTHVLSQRAEEESVAGAGQSRDHDRLIFHYLAELGRMPSGSPAEIGGGDAAAADAAASQAEDDDVVEAEFSEVNDGDDAGDSGEAGRV